MHLSFEGNRSWVTWVAVEVLGAGSLMFWEPWVIYNCANPLFSFFCQVLSRCLRSLGTKSPADCCQQPCCGQWQVPAASSMASGLSIQTKTLGCQINNLIFETNGTKAILVRPDYLNNTIVGPCLGALEASLLQRVTSVSLQTETVVRLGWMLWWIHFFSRLCVVL